MKTLITSFCLSFLMIFSLEAQVLEVNATVEYAHLPQDEHDDLVDLGMKIEQYFNNYSWVEDEFEYDVPCNIQVIIETVQKKTFEKMYKAQFLISSVSGENFYDKTWEFTYERSFPLNHAKGQFDPLTHFLDFYAYMVLAGELDSNGLLLGTPLYDKALDIANQGMLSQYARGWGQRLDDLQNITHLRTRPLREIKPDLFEAIYLHEQGKISEAHMHAKKVLTGIEKVVSAQPNNRYLTMFFKSHYRNLANLFEGHNEELEMLVSFDSKHRETYRDRMD